MRCCAAEKRALLEDNNVAPPAPGQVVGDTGTGDAAADNNDSGLIVHELVSYIFTSLSHCSKGDVSTLCKKRLR